jgi:REP element-mobilizing transposase RayT
MSSHVFHEIYLHINWHTLGSRPMITPSLEALIFDFIRQRCFFTPGVYFLGIGGNAYHDHLAISIEPDVLISKLIGDLKGSCSREINATTGAKVLDWQRGYAVVSFAKSDLPWVLEYVKNQKQHHANNILSPKLELTSDELLKMAKMEKPAEAGY